MSEDGGLEALHELRLEQYMARWVFNLLLSATNQQGLEGIERVYGQSNSTGQTNLFVTYRREKLGILAMLLHFPAMPPTVSPPSQPAETFSRLGFYIAPTVD